MRAALLAVALLLWLAPGALGAGRCGERPWCDTALGPDTRAALVLAQLTQAEKLELLWGDEQTDAESPAGRERHTGTNRGIARLGIPPLLLTDGPAGVRQGTGAATSLPAPLALAAAWDPALARRAGGLVGTEARLRGNDVVYAPTVNLMRTPRGGRTFEGYGEDPFLIGRTAVGWIRGAQAAGVIANVKHFAANNQETDRMTIDARMDERTLREVYLPHFEAAVREGGAGTVMCAYNKVNGRHACENEHLLRDVLRRDWGFEGVVLSDYPAAHDTGASLRNGLDFEPSGFAYAPAATSLALTAGSATQADVDGHVARILRTMFAFGLFDREAEPPQPRPLPVAEHAAVAREIAEGGITLLENRGAVLPLRGVRSLAVVGPDADILVRGGGSSLVPPTRTATPLAGIAGRARRAGVAVRAEGSEDPARAAAAARNADVAIVVVADRAEESKDQPCLRLDCTDGPRDSDAIVRAVAAANPRTVVVLETSGPVLTPWREEVAALVQAWYPGQSGGDAIARVLWGDVDPGGRLPATFPAREADLPTAGDPARFPGVGGVVRHDEGVLVGYRWWDARELEPAYPFGFGRSYTRFAFSGLRVVRDAGGGLRVAATVRNVGRRRGTAVPQLYLGLPAAPGLVQPPWQLRGFEKLSLRRGERRRVRWTLPRRALAHWDVARGGWAVAPGRVRVGVGSSSRDLPLRGGVG